MGHELIEASAVPLVLSSTRAGEAGGSAMAPPRQGEEQGVVVVVGGGTGDSAPALRAPAHVMARVFSQLDCVDLLSCSLVCKQWYRDSAELREDWRMEYLDAWNQFGLSVTRAPQPLCATCAIRSLRSLCP